MEARRARPAAPKKNTARKATTTKRAGAAGVNHKTVEAQKARDDLDQGIVNLLGQKANKDGLGKTAIATKLASDATAVKASLNRLIHLSLIRTSGTTMNTVYTAVENAAMKLKEHRTKNGVARRAPRRSSHPAAAPAPAP